MTVCVTMVASAILTLLRYFFNWQIVPKVPTFLPGKLAQVLGLLRSMLCTESPRSFNLFLDLSNQNWPKSLIRQESKSSQYLKNQYPWPRHAALPAQKSNHTKGQQNYNSWVCQLFFLVEEIHSDTHTFLYFGYNILYLNLQLINALKNVTCIF